MTTPEFKKISAQLKLMFKKFREAFPLPEIGELRNAIEDKKWELSIETKPSTAETMAVANMEARIEAAAEFLDNMYDIARESDNPDVARLMERADAIEFLVDVRMPGPPFFMRTGMSDLAAAHHLTEAKTLMHDMLKTVTAMYQQNEVWVKADKLYKTVLDDLEDSKIERSVFESFSGCGIEVNAADAAIKEAEAKLEAVDCEMKSAYKIVQEVNVLEEVEAVAQEHYDKHKKLYELEAALSVPDPEGDVLDAELLAAKTESEKISREPCPNKADLEAIMDGKPVADVSYIETGKVDSWCSWISREDGKVIERSVADIAKERKAKENVVPSNH